MEYLSGKLSQSVNYLQQGLAIAEQLLRKEDEARIRHRLGLALWQNGDLEAARGQLDTAARLFQAIRRDVKGSAEFKLSLYDLQTACYQALQRILVLADRTDEALAVAELARNRAFTDLLLERQNNRRRRNNQTPGTKTTSAAVTSQLRSVNELERLVNRQKAAVLYYSLAGGYLYVWLILPGRGIVRFHQTCLEDDEDEAEEKPECERQGYLLHNYIANVRESLGIETGGGGGVSDEEDNTAGAASGVWSAHLEELGDKLNQDNDRTGFLRMVNRSSRMNASSYSLSSLFSVGSIGGCSITAAGSGGLTPSSRAGSTRSRRRSGWQGHASTRNLYQLLIQPMEEDLPEGGGQNDLLLVLEGDLYLVPFPVLRGSNGAEYLCERFNLLVMPSLTSLKTRAHHQPNNNKTTKLLTSINVNNKSIISGSENTQSSGGGKKLVVGNPRIPSSVTDHWGWADVPQAEQEANIVAEILQTSALVGAQATKDNILGQLEEAESVHLASHVSWKLSAVVVSPGEFVESSSTINKAATNINNICSNNNIYNSQSRPYSLHSDTIHEEEEVKSEEDGPSTNNTLELPALSEFLLTAADILQLRLSAKLVVISSCHPRGGDQRHHHHNHHQGSAAATSDGVIGLTRALLAAGARCVLVSLWPVPDTAAKLMMKAFYSSLLQGARASRALAEAMTAVQTTKYFQHPANWAGFLLVGQDIKLTDKVALMGQALRQIIAVPDSCRDALRVTLHLVRLTKKNLFIYLGLKFFLVYECQRNLGTHLN